MTKDEIAQSIIKSGIGHCTLTAIECKICPCVGACVGGDKAGRVRSANDYLSEHGESTSSGKPVDHFEVGKWYTHINANNGKPVKCIYLDFRGVDFDCGAPNHASSTDGFLEVPDPSAHDSVSGLPRVGNCRCSLGELITDKVVGKPDEFNPSSVKSRSQRRAEILHGLTID
jgi:hypothetical protein